ncbi:hypothetical protein [Streptomyces sp. SP2-10]|uniref:hypothetical protein n=1 Tax=Streptomyces sp. SP2-10 TaxID=2873385 RepID=UPI001CA67F42|nr:hypothetical protein [Streptomyces sp. SP2-10]MBY8840993.1 hypothetical protein [Streptomyces sp. SP2-10]
MGPPQLSLAWALAEAQAHHLAGLGIFARAERSAAKQRAEADAPLYLAAEEARLHSVHQRLVAEADQWRRCLLGNDEETVCETVDYAFSDNPAAGCALGVSGLQSLLDHAQDDPAQGDATLVDLDGDLRAHVPDAHSAHSPDHYRIRPFAEWKSQATLSPSMAPGHTATTAGFVPAPPSHPPATALASACPQCKTCPGTS